MSGVGLPELVIITVIVVLLFGAPVLTFFVGYLLGKNRAATDSVSAPTDQPSTAEEPADE